MLRKLLIHGMIATSSAEVVRVPRHWLDVGPKIGLRLSRLEAVPAATTADMETFRALVCKVNTSMSFETVKAPVAVGVEAT
jgi:hypothetical protein